MSTTDQVSSSTQRLNGKCRACKKHHTVLVKSHTVSTYRDDRIAKPISRKTTVTISGTEDRYWITTCCDRPVDMKPVRGTRNTEIACGAKCQSSRGHVCECACGGLNHGGGR